MFTELINPESGDRLLADDRQIDRLKSMGFLEVSDYEKSVARAKAKAKAKKTEDKSNANEKERPEKTPVRRGRPPKPK